MTIRLTIDIDVETENHIPVLSERQEDLLKEHLASSKLQADLARILCGFQVSDEFPVRSVNLDIKIQYEFF